MATGLSNSYIEPVVGASLNGARQNVNGSLRAILSNFKSKVTPSGVNIIADGANLGEVDGMLYRSATTNALYISDTVHAKSRPVGGNFTRIGIGNRVENGYSSLIANAHTYEIGELVATVSENTSLAANAKLYLCVSNTVTPGTADNFRDVGFGQGFTITTNDNVVFSGQSVSAIRYIASSNIAIGTNTPGRNLDVGGDARLGGVYLDTYIYHNNDVDTYFGFLSNDVYRIVTNGNERLRVDSGGQIGIGTASPASALHVQGTITSVDINTTSDRRFKDNIKTIENSTEIVNKIRPVSFDWKDTGNKAFGVIAQELEEILPELVATSKDNNRYVSYIQLIPFLIGAIQELSEEVKSLKENN